MEDVKRKKDRRIMVRAAIVMAILVSSLLTPDVHGQPKVDKYLRENPNAKADVDRFSNRSLHEFAGLKQLKLRTHAVQDGRFVANRTGSWGWDIVPLRPNNSDLEHYAIKYQDLYLRYDPKGEKLQITLTKDNDEGTVWRAVLSGVQRSGGVDGSTNLRRPLRLEVVNGPRKGDRKSVV